MRTILALAAAAAVGAIMASSPASAASECVNGLQSVGPNLIVYCDGGPTAQQSVILPEEAPLGAPADTAVAEPLYTPPPGAPEEPLYTGSIAPAPEEPLYTGSVPAQFEPPAAGESLMVDNPSECQPGHYWMMSSSDSGGNRAIACPRG